MGNQKSQDTTEDDPRYQTKKYKMRKAIRKAERKSAKQRHHINMLEWKQRHKQSKGSLSSVRQDEPTIKKPKQGALVQHESLPISTKKSKEKTYEDLELEYLERQLLKNKKGVDKEQDLFSTLRSEFVNDGFDEDFLDFLSSLNDLAEGKKRTSLKAPPEPASLHTSSNVSEDDVARESDPSMDEDYDHDDDLDEERQNIDQATNEGRKRVKFNLPAAKQSKATNDNTVLSATNIGGNKSEIGNISEVEFNKRQMGLLNRISEGNFITVVKELIGMYTKVLSIDAGEVLADARLHVADNLIKDLCGCTVKMVIENEGTVVSLVAIHTALICALCNTIGINVGYMYCDMLIKTMEKSLPILFKNEGNHLSEAKLVVRNCVMSFAVMSHFDMLDIETIFFLFKNIPRDGLTDHIAQILMVLLRYTGHKMKSQNQSAFNSTIEHLNHLLDQYKKTHGDITQSRLRFFEQEIQSFKLSNEKKPLDTFEFLKNHLKVEFRYQGGVTNPQIDHKTLMKFTKAFDSTKSSSHTILKNLNTSSILSVKSSIKDDPNSTTHLLQKANALRLYSNCQKSTFVAIMGALDPDHAVERIMDIGFKSTQYTEVVNTVIHSLMCEKLYNAFYTAVITKLARLPSATGKRFTRACVCSLIANIEHLHEKKPRKCSHLGRFFASLVVGNVLELKLLKFLKKEYIDSTSVEAFMMSLFAFLVAQPSVNDEELVIAQLLSIKNEDVYELICELWYDYLQDHCMEKLVSSNSGSVIMEACRRIFTTNTTS